MAKFKIILPALLFTCTLQVQCQEGTTKKPQMQRLRNCIMNFPKYATFDDFLACNIKPKDKNSRNQNCNAYQCLLSRNELMDGSKVNRAAFQTFMENHSPDDFKPAIIKSIQTCNQQVESNTEDCEAKTFIKCFKRNLVINVPDSAWKNTDECSELKMRVKNRV